MDLRSMKRKTVRDRLEAVKRIEDGETVKKVAKEYNVSAQAVRNWLRQKRKLQKTAERSGPGAISCEDNSHALALRRAVYDWFKEQRTGEGQPKPMSSSLIAKKALELNAAMGGSPDFKASSGWVHTFKKAFGIRQGRFIQLTKTDSDDNVTAEAYRAKLHSIMEERGLTPDQVYNADESGLFTKCLPNTTPASKADLDTPGLSVDKTRVSILFCSNATGDHKLPLLVIGKSACPLSISKEHRKILPGGYIYSKKAWMTAKIFKAWVRGQFEPCVKKYLRSKGLPMEALLLLDEAPCHNLAAKSIGIIKIEYLPQNIACSIQPMKRGAIALFKRAYRLFLLQRLVETLDLNIDAELKKMSVLVALQLSARAWDGIKAETMAKCWKPMGFKNQKLDSPSTVRSIVRRLEDEIIQTALILPGLKNLNHEHVVKWCKNDPQDVSDDICEEEYEVLNPKRVFQSGQGLSISHEEGAAVLDRALRYAQQFPQCAPYLEALTKIRDEAAKDAHNFGIENSPRTGVCMEANHIKEETDFDVGIEDEEPELNEVEVFLNAPIIKVEFSAEHCISEKNTDFEDFTPSDKENVCKIKVENDSGNEEY